MKARSIQGTAKVKRGETSAVFSDRDAGANGLGWLVFACQTPVRYRVVQWTLSEDGHEAVAVLETAYTGPRVEKTTAEAIEEDDEGG